MFVIYGFEAPDSYLESVMREVKLPEEDATDLVDDISDEVILPIINASENPSPSQTHVSAPVASGLPEVAPESHPVIVPGQTAHEAPRVPQPPQQRQTQAPSPNIHPQEMPTQSQPNRNSYPGGRDPYREPIE